jgi:hypothetical protein
MKTELYNTESYNTISFTSCISSKNHEINCDCDECIKCRNDIIKFYKNKAKIKIKKKKIFDNLILNDKLKNYSVQNVKNECLLCKNINGDILINDFYHLCKKCYYTNELQ